MRTLDRKVDTWEWYDDTLHPNPLAFDVRLRRPANVADGPIVYYIKSADPPIHIQASDLPALRDKLDAEVRAFCAVEWKSVIRVSLAAAERPLNYYGIRDVEAAVTIQIEEFERGWMGNEPVYRRRRPDNHKGAHRYSVYKGDGPSVPNDGAVRVHLPDTEQARAHVAAMKDRIRDLRGELSTLLTALAQEGEAVLVSQGESVG